MKERNNYIREIRTKYVNLKRDKESLMKAEEKVKAENQILTKEVEEAKLRLSECSV